MFAVNFDYDTYRVGFKNFSHIRRGDLIAILALKDMLCKELGREINFSITDTQNVEDMFPWVGSMFVPDSPKFRLLPLSGNLWAWWDYIYNTLEYGLSIPNKYSGVEESGIVLNPIFDAPYNKDRNWSVKLYNSLVDRLFETGIPIFVVCGRDYTVKVTDQPHKVNFIYGNVYSSMIAIATSKIYIGGDTGLTHFASTVAKNPKKIIALYGCGSDHRKNFECLDHLPILKYYVPDMDITKVRVDFTPKINGDKELLYILMDTDSNLDVEKMNKVVKFASE